MNSSLPIQRTEECLSQAFVHAIASYAGLSVAFHFQDFGIDGTFYKVIHHGERFIKSGMPLDFQLKATINWEDDNETVIYDMESKSFNDFVYRRAESCTPLRLILLCLPRNVNDWINVQPEHLLLRKCCYYFEVEGDVTENVSTIRIRIPKDNILTPDSLTNLMNSLQPS